MGQKCWKRKVGLRKNKTNTENKHRKYEWEQEAIRLTGLQGPG